MDYSEQCSSMGRLLCSSRRKGTSACFRPELTPTYVARSDLPQAWLSFSGGLAVCVRSGEQVRQYFKNSTFYEADVTQRGLCAELTNGTNAFACEAFSPSAATVKVRFRYFVAIRRIFRYYSCPRAGEGAWCGWETST